MSASLAARVNQRLAQARALLVDLRRAEEGGPPLRQAALRDACVFHCYCGLTHYVREICRYYGIRELAAVDSLPSARTLLAQQGKSSAELNELWQLQQRPDSWLAALVAHYRDCWALPEAAEKRADDRIAVVDLDASPPVALTAAALAEALDHFGQIIERQRESTTEY